MVALESLNRQYFSELLGSKFDLSNKDIGPVVVELVEVSEGRKSKIHEQFAVIFRGPEDVKLEQDLYLLSQPDVGDMELFLVPVGVEPDGRYLYEAVFNRLLPRTEESENE